MIERRRSFSLIAPAVVLLLASEAAAQPDMIAAWSQPQAPFRIVGNVHYVGTNELAAYLIATPEGHMLIDGGFAESAPLILASIRQLGFRPEDIKVLLTTQAHMDHVGSMAALRQVSGARVEVMNGDRELIERGGMGDFAFGDTFMFPAAPVDRTLQDGDTVSVGGTVLRAHHTPGHTRGCTTWTTTVTEGGRPVRVVFAGSLSVNPQVRLIRDPSYPGIADDYRRSFARLRAMEADVFLGAHAGFFDLQEKVKRLESGERNPFVDPAALGRYVDQWEAQFDQRVAQE